MRAARWWHGVTFAVAVAALALQTWLVLIGTPVLDDVAVPPLPIRLARLVSYFTIQSNVLVAVVAGLLARDPARDGIMFRVVRLAAVVGIAVTGIVHYVALRPLLHLTGGSWWADLGLHVIVPLLSVVGWAAFGPRPRVDLRTAGWAIVWPVLWLACTLIVGAITTWYPYPFLNAGLRGYAPVLLTSLVVTAVFLAVIGLVALVDRRGRPTPLAASLE